MFFPPAHPPPPNSDYLLSCLVWSPQPFQSVKACGRLGSALQWAEGSPTVMPRRATVGDSASRIFTECRQAAQCMWLLCSYFFLGSYRNYGNPNTNHLSQKGSSIFLCPFSAIWCKFRIFIAFFCLFAIAAGFFCVKIIIFRYSYPQVRVALEFFKIGNKISILNWLCWATITPFFT